MIYDVWVQNSTTRERGVFARCPSESVAEWIAAIARVQRGTENFSYFVRSGEMKDSLYERYYPMIYEVWMDHLTGRHSSRHHFGTNQETTIEFLNARIAASDKRQFWYMRACLRLSPYDYIEWK